MGNNNNSSSWNWNNNNTNNNNNNNNNSWNFNTNQTTNNNNYNNTVYNTNNPISVINKLLSEYSPNTPNCRFETILYNRVPKDKIASFEKPPCVRAVLWDQFVSKNPDKQNLVPVAVRGYNELCDRGRLCLAGHLSTINSFSHLANKIKERKQKDKAIKEKILELKQIQINL